MKKLLFVFAAAAVLLSSCEEWDPVVNLEYDDVYVDEGVTMTPNTTIAQLKALYKTVGEPVKLEDDDMIIGGQVISEDRSGNIYKSIFIQDETGAIEIKLGKNGLYNDYQPGRWVYVKPSGLTLGDYRGMLQLGWRRNQNALGENAADTDADGENSDEYETSYIEVDYIINSHIFKGKLADPVEPKILTSADLVANLNTRPIQQGPDFGRLVTLKGLKYGKEVFCLVYPEPNKAHDKTHSENRVFLSDKTWNITTWAMTAEGMKAHLQAGDFDDASLGDNSKLVSDPDVKALLIKNAAAYAVSQYFLMDQTTVQVRTSGYARFAEKGIDPDVLSGAATVDITGILTNYDGEIQFTLIDEDSVVVNK